MAAKVAVSRVDGRTRGRYKRRDRIFDIAITLFVEQGYDDTSMEQIAASAGVARATVFNHFPRKASFLEEWTARRRSQAARIYSGRTSRASSLQEVLGGYLSALVALAEGSRTETMKIMPLLIRVNGIHVEPLSRELASLLIDRSDELRPDIDAELTSRLIALGYLSACIRWAEQDPSLVLGEEMESLLHVVLEGARPAASAHGNRPVP